MRHRLVAGIGCRKGCPAEDILTAVRCASAETHRRVDCLAAPEFKAGESGILAAAELLSLPLVLIDALALSAVQDECVTRSLQTLQAVGFASVAEACALGAAGTGARLVLPRITFGAATCALAESVVR